MKSPLSALENRIPPPLLLLAVGIGMGFIFHWGRGSGIPAAWRWAAGGAAILGGLAVLAAGIAAFRRARTTIDPVHPDRATTLVAAGIYRYTRNPMYLGFMLLLAGWAALLGSAWALSGPGLLFAWIDVFQIRPEERALRRKFGEDYESYRRQVRRWI